jgi:hypothetical protein
MTSVAVVTVLCAIVFGLAKPAQAGEPNESCATVLQSRLSSLQTQVQYDPNARYDLERLALRCQGADPVTARFVSQVNADLVIASREVSENKISLQRYLVLLADRRVKLE